MIEPDRAKPVISCGKSRTKQEFKDQCNVNLILKRYISSGELSHISTSIPQYGDYSQLIDYHSALNIVREAETSFGELPADIRKRFGHSPQQLLEFMNDPSNNEEAEKLGLLPPGAEGLPVEKATPETTPAPEPTRETDND